MKKYSYGHPKFYKIVEELCDLHSWKSKSYGKKDDPLFNLRLFGWRGVVVRLGDKFCRLKNFYDNPDMKLPDETIIDAFNDMSIYAALGRILYEEENKK